MRAFNIYVDNPCCVLTQEESKKFIQGHEKEKYEFFLKVVCLRFVYTSLSVENRPLDYTESRTNWTRPSEPSMSAQLR